MTEVTVIEFNEIPWGNRNMRGGSFGVRGKSWARFSGRGPFLIHCPTGMKPEKRLDLKIAMHSAFLHPDEMAVFTDTPDGSGAKMKMNELFLSESGEDEWPGRLPGGELRYRGADCSLRQQTSYYITIPELPEGHPDVRHGFTIRYTSTSPDDVSDMAPAGEKVIHQLTGEMGTWVADTEE